MQIDITKTSWTSHMKLLVLRNTSGWFCVTGIQRETELRYEIVNVIFASYPIPTSPTLLLHDDWWSNFNTIYWLKLSSFYYYYD